MMAGARNVLLVHNTFTSAEDLAYCGAARLNRQLFFCLCPNANLYIENRLPDLGLLRAQRCRIVLGTDSLASNDGLSILGEIKTLMHYFPEIPQEELLGWATLEGARALQMHGSLGSFEKGKKPGIILIDQTRNGQISQKSGVRRIM